MKKAIIIFLLLTIISKIEASDNTNKKFALTAGNIYIGAKYNFIQRFSIELRSAFDNGVLCSLGRLNCIFWKIKKLNSFIGFEYGYILFNYENISGKGYVVSPFIGAEYFLKEKFSVGTDIGYSIINLKSKNFSINGPEIILNFGVNYYLF